MARKRTHNLERIAKHMHKGALTERAKRAGFSTASAYCNARQPHHGKAARQCALARTFSKYRKGGKRRSRRRT